MERKAINLKVPFQKPPFSHAVKANGLVFCSGQIPQDLETGQMIYGDIRTQTRQVLQNLKRILEASGSSLEKVLKCTVFMSDLGQFEEMNEVYKEFFVNDPPARSTVQVSALAKGVGIEIELVALE